ncbi:MarR family transcriptional regulator [Paracoccus versutus]|uniref:DNA-binding MarR family transcriptional regulator n=1 Tax=Paracoccus versutus TaxID=34007 RepID=A0AAQ0KLT1_PARVE|nr:MarR family transcriptional regulator [Paracoccus versutus]REG45934.1 DNA-binding MarR family transcriptional regulator [Paracoccus versutus]WEJ77623.1 MarR family transcriptional regulator [Paracoccus versutus]
MSRESAGKPKYIRGESPRQLRDLVGYHLKRASALDLHGANAALEASGLRTVQMSVLLTITEQPGISSADICRVLRMQRANIVPVLADLESRGLFLRETDPNDSRIQRLFPTGKGRDEASHMLGLVATHEDRMLARLTPAERDDLRRMLALIWKEDGDG